MAKEENMKDLNSINNYDIIGDIHGYADKLVELLLAMEYQLNDKGYYSHPTRTAMKPNWV